MQNYIESGDVITVPAPAAVSSGDGVKAGQLFGVASLDAASGADVAIKTTGVFDLPKAASQAWTVGALVYWDATNKDCTTTSTSNLLIGSAVLAVTNAAGNTTGRVRLNGVARADEASA